MTRRLSLAVGAGVLALTLGSAAPARAQSCGPNCTPLSRYSYYPYYYFPHSYWPSMSPRWPEPGHSCNYCPAPPPGYMSYPPFLEPMWRYELWQPQPYYRGFHFWLDQF